MIIGFDLDGVIAKQTGGWTPQYYQTCTPDRQVVKLMRFLHNRGDKIIIYTARLENTAKVDTLRWLEKHEVVFDAIHFDKPLYDVMIDDKSLTIEQVQQLFVKEEIV